MKKQITIDLKPDQINDSSLIRKIAARNCRVPEAEITGIEYVKRSLDSRNKKNKYMLQLNVYVNEPIPKKEEIKAKYRDIDRKLTNGKHNQVVIIGAGPAGYFAALELLEHGIKPVVLERGKDVQARRHDIKDLLKFGTVNNNSNYCFGEGGAGAYSDGKLYTRSNKRGDVKKVLQIFIEHGANPDILIDAHPHIGSNVLPKIISAMRETILQHGGEVHFDTKVTDIILRDNQAVCIRAENSEEFPAQAVILATGHSARDIYYMFNKKQLFIEVKPYAVGFRVEHSQQLIDNIQYGVNHLNDLPPAAYSLATQVGDSGVFTFCMCPGGIIVPSVTAASELVVNGMSMSGRNSAFANAGVVTSVDESDFQEFKEFAGLAGLKYQEMLEQRFYTGNAENPLKAPAQRIIDFSNGKLSKSLNATSYIPGLELSDMTNLFPRRILRNLQMGLKNLGSKMNGFMTNEANAIGLESRTSSPVRITRNRETYSHVEIENLYPCGEGAGYAGGIVSSAIDGQNAVQALIRKMQ